MVAAMSVIANGGKMVEPHLAKQVADADGNVLETYTPRFERQVVTPQTAQAVTKALEQVMIDGTGKDIKVPGLYRRGCRKNRHGAEDHRRPVLAHAPRGVVHRFSCLRMIPRLSHW